MLGFPSALGSSQVHSIAEKSQKKLWKATKTPTIKIHVAVVRNIRTVAISRINKFKIEMSVKYNLLTPLK